MSSQTPGFDPNYPQGNQPGYSAAPPYTGGSGGAATSLNMPDAVRIVLSKYADFSGRARRSEYWWFALANFIASVVASIIDQALGAPVLTIILALGLLIPGLAVGVRRLHDTGRSGWWLLIALVPLVGAIILLVFLCTDSQQGPNNWGPSPKYAAATGY